MPIPKKGDSSDPSNFRPVSLLSNVAKLQERIVFKNIYNFLMEIIYFTNINLGFYHLSANRYIPSDL